MSTREKGNDNIFDVIHHELNDELRELASLHVLSLLEADEALRWENHVQRCDVCAAETHASDVPVRGIGSRGVRA